MDMFDSLNLTLTNPVLPQQAGKSDSAPQAKKERFAKDFESIFMEKLLDEMKNTIGNWGFEPDAASKQIQGLFWLYLARDTANNGGLGMWKDIYQSLGEAENKTPDTKAMDNE